ncbi:MAG TPA: SDR family NAD(P)-dependent oxidoreductase [Thermoanaerobaculia bacterium]|nr:SDR family NAD(P)-dependent oxidoreductase [Thermoanaerobaculia bacterium]
MKRFLQKIYDDVVNGRLSQSEALERVRALKLQEQGASAGVLLATPVWQTPLWQTMDGEVAAGASAASTERHVILGELPQVDAQELASLLPLSRCVSVTAGPQSSIAQRYTGYALACFERIQKILHARPHGKVLVQLVAAGDEEQALFAGLAGLLRTMALENPQLSGQIILVPAHTTAADLATLLTAEQSRALDTVVRYAPGVRQVLHWQELPATAKTSPATFEDDGVYMITGGLGGLGMLFIHEILERAPGAQIVLTGRSALSGEKQSLLDGLSRRVTYQQLDLGDFAQVEQLIAGIRDEHGRLDGILHCAGMVADNFILKKSSAEFSEVLAPKVTGTVNLDQASRDVELDFFVLFSSVAGAIGNVGQADYATANGFMDQFAAYRNRQVAAGQRHGRTRSIDWPLWQAGGMSLDPATLELVLRTTGGKLMRTATGMDAFHRSLALPYDQILVAEGDLTQMRRVLLAGAVVPTEPRAEQAAVTAAIDVEDLAGKTREYLRRELSGLLKLPSHQIDPDAALETYGINSILALKLTDHLEKTFGALSRTLFFEYQTIGELTKYFLRSHSARLATLFAGTDSGRRRPKDVVAPRSVQPKQASSRRAAPARRAPTESDPIAIIGLSGRYPEAVDVDAYWQNLRDGKDCITEVPKERWAWQAYFSEDRNATGHHLSKWGGFITGVDEFDPLFFNISPKEAKAIDPQERLFLQHAWMAIEDAGYTRASLQVPSADDLPGQVGVYVGVMYMEYQLFGAEAGAQGRRMGIPGSMASIANRVSYVLNLHGPSMTLDTMCSSSLTAIHLACQDLKLGRTSLAIAGGVNVSVHPNKYLVLSAGQFLSSDGHCQSFGEGGDGYIPGEGVGAVVLKRLSEAKRDGDHIYGVIRGSALNHGGKTNGYSVPNPLAQGSAIGRALAESYTDARHVSYIEAHGTGTKLGDPIEIAALNRAFQSYTQDTGFCLIGSAKSNIGHCESAAGIAGLTKVLLQMQHQQIVPSLHSAQLNPHIDFPASPFVVNQSLRPWEQPVIDGVTLPRIAGLSSFGAGGSNAHLVIEEYQAPVHQPMAFAQVVILLSARTAEQLQQKARELLAFLQPRLNTIDLGSLAYTLQAGREAMDERFGLVVSSAEELVEKLQAFVAGEHEIEDAYRGQVKRDRETVSLFGTDSDLQETVDKWLTGGKLAMLLELWVKGLAIDWRRLYGETTPPRISLPTYPFARERYWIDLQPGPVAAKQVATRVRRAGKHRRMDARLRLAAGITPVKAATAPAPRETLTIASRREIVLVSDVSAERKKPASISLAAPGGTAATPATARAPRTLSDVSTGSAVPAASPVRLYEEGDGIFSIQLGAGAARDVVPLLLSALARVQQETSVKVLRIGGAERGLDHDDALAHGLYQAVISFPYPVIAVLQGDTAGAGFLFAALCDFMVCDEDAHYGFTDVQRHVYRTSAVAEVFSERFGELRAQDLLYGSTTSTGKQLRAKGWTCPILPSAEIELYTRGLASALAAKSRDALRLLKQHLTRNLAARVAALTPVDVAMAAPETEAKPLASILQLRIAAAKDLVAELGDVFAKVASSDYKAVVLASDGPDFLQDVSDDDVAQLQRVILESEIPVVAALEGNARGKAWLVAQWCDACVYSETGVYSAGGIGQTAAASFTHRFGAEAAREILLTGADYRGVELRQRVGTLLVTERERVLPTAIELAEHWATLPPAVLASWKSHSASTLPTGSEQNDETPEPAIAAPAPILLQSHAVTATAHPGGIVVVKMEDRDAKNMFSEALIAGLTEAFAHIEQTPAYKVVVLTGYDSYFASGGTKEGLLAIQAGKAKFTDTSVFQLPLDCRLPVIAAMQGHGIGAGWSLGMFADVVLLSEESRYVSPYMEYGFTPGAGATWVLSDRFGHDLSRESLLTARPSTGRELKERGVRLSVLPRAEVEAAAMALAKQIAQHSRSRSIALKQQLTAYVRQPLEETYRLEVAMHEQTFVGQADTLAQIQTRFHQESEPPVPVEAAPRMVASDALAAVTATLRTLLANELQMRESDVDEHAQFIDLGLDSISGVTWIRKINDRYQTSIEATKVYAYPTLAQFSRHVLEEAETHGTLPMPEARVTANAAAAPAAHVPSPAARLASRRSRRSSRRPAAAGGTEPIAIVGMAGQFPQANDLEAFWRNLAEGKNCITEVPGNRWDVDAYYQPGGVVPGKTYSQWLGALEQFDLFDPLFFNISPTEAENMDPQQRLFLQACWHSIENAGYDARVLSGSKCGVFVGCAAGDYHEVSPKQQLSAHGFTGNAMSILAARISYFLNLQGPCVSIDTACSSSLVAIAQACDSLNSGSSDLALAGGVYVMAGPQMHIMTSQAAMLSPAGRCFTFDQRADGFVPGEGVGVVMLKRLADARRDGDLIQGVIQGWGVNQDGRTNGITAPNPDSQTRLEQDVYDKYRINPEHIQLIEAHGTGTKLGDPIEVDGLKASFKKYTRKQQFCAIGSVKSNIGHCLTAAGIAGVIKLLLALKHRQLPPTINFERLNEHMDLTESPFFVNTSLQKWSPGDAAIRQAAISSFGFSGTNAHLVIGEHLPAAEVARAAAVTSPNGNAVIPLSARTAGQLQQKARDLLDFIRTERSTELRELAYTLQVGRTPMEERLGFVVSSIEQLTEKLDAWLEGERNLQDVHEGGVKRNREALSLFSSDADLQETIDKWIAHRKLPKVLELWVKGFDLEWSKLYGDARPQRVALPLYPFAKERYWIEAAATEQAVRPRAAHRARMRALVPRRRRSSTPTQEPSRPLFFRECWKEQSSPSTAVQPNGTKFILFTNPERQAALVDSDVDGHFADALVVHQAQDYRKVLEEAAAAAAGQPITIIYTWAQGKGLEGIHDLFELFKTVRASAHPIGHVILAGRYDPAVAETCWEYSWGGFERSLRHSLPNTRISVLYTNASACTAQQLLEVSQDGGIFWYRDDRRLVLSIEPVELSRVSEEPVLRHGATYLITGGGGALGLKFARHLAESYGAKLLLLGRRARTSEIQAQLDMLVAAGSRDAQYHAVDVSDEPALRAWAQSLTDSISGIIHAAGVESEGTFFERTASDIDAVLRAKTLGTLALDEVFRDHPLDFICHFSSTAGSLGDHGAADYAVASRFQTAHGARLQASGKTKTLVINWPFWQDGGMGFKDQEQAARYLKMAALEFGNEPLSTQAGLEIWHDLLQAGQPQTMVMVGQPARVEKFLQKVYHGARRSPVIRPKPAEAVPRMQQRQVEDELRASLAELLHLTPSQVDVDQPFSELGLDSFLGTEWINAINKRYGTAIATIAVYDYATVRALASLVEQQLPASAPAQEVPASQPREDRAAPRRLRPIRRGRPAAAEKIAIIGMSGRYPQAPNLRQYWRNLAEGKNSIVEIPPHRWDVSRFYDPAPDAKERTCSKWLGSLDDIDCFDPLFFRIAPHDAVHMDPQHRLFLEESYKAFEDAGYSSDALNETKCGVYLGISNSEYALRIVQNGAASAPVTSMSFAVAAARIAYYLNLKGPAIAVDTACSSSLVALHLACQALVNGETDMALAGGANLWLAPETYLSMSQAGMLSPTGQCRAFDDAADGIVVGEGVGVVVLKRLKDAERDQDLIYGVILGSGINQDGRTNGITAPSVHSQTELLRNVYSRYNIDPSTISYVETHGTGTKLGDPIELTALSSVFKENTARKNYCALASVKSNIGHTAAAAGVASLQKVLLSMQHRTLVPTLHVAKESTHFDFADSPFYISRQTQKWDADVRRAAISSFGFSGTNAHVVIEEYPSPVAPAGGDANYIVPLSARSEEQLRQKAADLLECIAASQPVDLAGVAYTLQVGRDAMEERLGFIVSSMEQLAEKLSAYLAGTTNIENVYRGGAETRSENMTFISRDDDMQEAIDRWIARKKLPKLLELWTRGVELDWKKLYGDVKPRRVSLPTYPFAKEHYWIDDPPVSHTLEHKLEIAGNLRSIEEVIDRIGDDAIDADEAVRLLRVLV